MLTIAERERQEIKFWKNENMFNSLSRLPLLLNKMAEAEIFFECIKPFIHYINNANIILELGAGQGWAACMVKKINPSAYVIASDISQDAINGIYEWERIFNVIIDQKRVCKSYEIDMESLSVDFIFCFAAAHHFALQEKTLKEIYRVLKPGGYCVYLYEPSCRKYIYPIAYKRVNKKRPMCPEDVLIYPTIKKIAERIGFDCNLQFFPNLIRRGFIETIYYKILSIIPILRYWLPCTINYQFIKRNNGF